MSRIKKVSRAYAVKSIKPGDILKLLELFPAQNIYMEAINIKKDSHFCTALQSGKEGRALFSHSSTECCTDIFIPVDLDRRLEEMLVEIIESSPEMLLFYLTDLAPEDFLRYDRGRFCDRMIESQVSSCIIEMMFEENTCLISYNSHRYSQIDLQTKLDEIFG